MVESLIIVAVTFFVGGVFVGVRNTAGVNNAINTIKSAEQSAQAVLAKITAHKAS